MSDKRRDLTLVSVRQNFDDITGRLVRHLIGNIESFDISKKTPKMMNRLMREVSLGVEMHFAKPTREYITQKINEQIAMYIAVGMPRLSGFSEEEFRRKLCALTDALLRYFAPPSRHPITDGEFTFLIVLPPEWVSLRAQVALLCGPDALGDMILSPLRTDAAKKTPTAPYAIIGINGGRGLKDLSFEQADEFVTKKDLSYFALHEATQLFLVQPKFLSGLMDIHSAQAQAYALGEQCGEKLIRFTAQDDARLIEFPPKKHVTGVGIGKPYYTDIVTTD